MTSTVILSDNGTSSGSAGLKTTGGNDGVLILQTTTSGGTATNAIYVDNKQNVGVGATPSSQSTYPLLQVGGQIGLWSATSTNNFIYSNSYYDGANDKYATSAYASRIVMGVSGQGISLETASSGSAGANVTYTTAFAVAKDYTCALQGGTSTSGTGIAFPATQSASTNANTLDDYEEGSWTPTLGGNTVYNTQVGRYTKIGNKVFLEGILVITTLGTGDVGNIYGMPFTSSASTPLGIANVGYYASSATSITMLAATIGQGATSINLRSQGNAAVSMNAVTFFQNGTSIYFTAQYTV